ncbi:MAG TPA: periplasmic heavy metal sensor [Nitrospira sp.]
MRLDRYVVLGTALGVTLLSTPFALADGRGQCDGRVSHAMYHSKGHAHGSGHMLRHLLKNKQELGLSDEQIAKLRTVALDSDRARIRAKADVKVGQRELKSLIWDENADMSAIEAKVKEKESFEATVQIIGIKARRDLMGVLTPEQKTKLKALWEQRNQRQGQMMHAQENELMKAGDRIDVSLEGSEDDLDEPEDGMSIG